MNRRRLALSPLWFLIALLGLISGTMSSASASGGLETRVRAIDHISAEAVGRQADVSPASVGCLRPSDAAIVSGACVATEAAGSSIDDVLRPGGDLLGKAGSNAAIREVTGGLSEAQATFSQLTQGGTVVSNSTYPGTLVRLPDGGTVGIRTVMSNSPNTAVTIDVNIPGFDITKIKFNP